MRYLLAMVVLFLPISAAATPPPAYVDTARVRAKASEPARLDAKFNAEVASRQKTATDAIEAAQKAKPSEQSAAWARAEQVKQEQLRAVGNGQAALETSFYKRLVEVLTKLRADKHLGVITVGPGVMLVPGVDLTDEAVKTWDAMDGQALAAQVDELQRQLAARAPQPDASGVQPTRK